MNSLFKTNFIEKLSLMICNKIDKYDHKDELDFLKMNYGIEVFLLNASKLMIIFILSIFTSIQKETLFMIVIFGFLRRSAFGLHSKNSFTCTLVCILMFIVTPLLSKFLFIPSLLTLSIMVVCGVALYIYAPGETEGHPIANKAKLKKITSLKVIALIILAIFIKSQYLNTLLMFTLLFQTIGILPITYKLLNRRYINE